ncbi:hypothetical protein A2W13_03255 [Candidatus Woesebacteria bacterium RBG_16_36_11]|uniref:Uncharacterized protein n=3 Tax=Candidatus Woeseibacteriota TaxID=1752722 RepID=A0A1F7XDT2_9BACT|nr:MAG: hypothetical protein A2Z67_00335 [Candidatus Woesebacteria bacterium RBG_13_36_22]OGM12475.1 MAG: hypothetical protein A2W13_03255 [Candidatus Woesebacteria bacterium RBG_16_36_11]OGM17356.1 MAG: hypothetical protein A2V55_00110 [Candidatus Woesebacteria bacterium RBG_19FT_COMBO_37_29]
MAIKAIIFDLNGTILSDEDEYGIAFKKVLQRLGAKVKEDYPQTTGIGVEENWPILIKKYNLKTEKTSQELALETQNEYLKLLPRITVRKGFIDFIREVRKNGISVALATSNSRLVTDKILEKCNLANTFDFITTCEEVTLNKPDPQIYNIALKKMEIPPQECLVFEDSKSGVAAAKKAGIKVIGVTRDKNHIKELADADKIIYDFDEINLNIL